MSAAYPPGAWRPRAVGIPMAMEGGIGILLLLIIVVVAIVVGVALYLTGGALWFGKTSAKGDQVEGDAETAERPRFKRVDQPPEEHVTLAGTEAGEREHREHGSP
jgi:hypothetical protein